MEIYNVPTLLKDHPLRHAAAEFYLAVCAYRKMVKIGVSNFAEYEKSWRDFLHRIERVWVKTQAAVYGLPNWKQIESEVVKLRKEDPLLSYLQQARHVEEHSIADIVRDWHPGFEVKQKGNNVELKWKEWNYRLLPVKNRGNVYNPPSSHMGRKIEHLKHEGKAEPRVIAELALRFYCDFLNRVSAQATGINRGCV
jgi:hypothetical protein